MLVYSFLAAGLIVIFLVNFRNSEAVALIDRVAISLVIAGVALLPLSMWLLFIPSFALIILGAVGLAIPTKGFYERRDARRRMGETLLNQTANGLCPNCDCVLPMSAPACPNCDADFGSGSACKGGRDTLECLLLGNARGRFGPEAEVALARKQTFGPYDGLPPPSLSPRPSLIHTCRRPDGSLFGFFRTDRWGLAIPCAMSFAIFRRMYDGQVISLKRWPTCSLRIEMPQAVTSTSYHFAVAFLTCAFHDTSGVVPAPLRRC